MTSAKQLSGKKPAQQVKAVASALSKIEAVLVKAKSRLESSGVASLEGGQLPEDVKTREAVAYMIENSCFAADFLLRFPDLVHAHLRSENSGKISHFQSVFVNVCHTSNHNFSNTHSLISTLIVVNTSLK